MSVHAQQIAPIPFTLPVKHAKLRRRRVCVKAPPLRGAFNPLYVQVHNRGWKSATNVKVKALWAHPDFFHVEIDRGTLPKGTSIDVRLPGPASTGPGTYRVPIPAQSRVRAAVSVALPHTVTPATAFRFSVIQRWRERSMGGSTYEVRVPPVLIRIGGQGVA
jgi:hypothetical protein